MLIILYLPNDLLTIKPEGGDKRRKINWKVEVFNEGAMGCELPPSAGTPSPPLLPSRHFELLWHLTAAPWSAPPAATGVFEAGRSNPPAG